MRPHNTPTQAPLAKDISANLIEYRIWFRLYRVRSMES
jgi:hypothetical protein